VHEMSRHSTLQLKPRADSATAATQGRSLLLKRWRNTISTEMAGWTWENRVNTTSDKVDAGGRSKSVMSLRGNGSIMFSRSVTMPKNRALYFQVTGKRARELRGPGGCPGGSPTRSLSKSTRSDCRTTAQVCSRRVLIRPVATLGPRLDTGPESVPMSS